MCKHKNRKAGLRLRQKPIESSKMQRVAADLLAGVLKNTNIASFYCWRAARTIQTYERLLSEAGIKIPARTD